MDINQLLQEMDIYSILLSITTILASISTTFNKTHRKLKGTVVESIRMAEEKYLDQKGVGVQKKEWVMQKLKSIIPVPLKPIFSDKLLNSIIEDAFLEIEKYAKTQVMDGEVKLLKENDTEPTKSLESQQSIGAATQSPELKKSDFVSALSKEIYDASIETGNQTVNIENSNISQEKPVENTTARRRSNGAKPNSTSKQMYDNSFVQNKRVQKSLRIHALWGRHNFICRINHSIRKRYWQSDKDWYR